MAKLETKTAFALVLTFPQHVIQVCGKFSITWHQRARSRSTIPVSPRALRIRGYRTSSDPGPARMCKVELRETRDDVGLQSRIPIVGSRVEEWV